MPNDINQEKAEFSELLDKVDCKNPSADDIKKAEIMLRDKAYLWCASGIAGSIVDRFLEQLNPQKSQQLLIKADAQRVKDELGYWSANQIERLIIEQVLYCWAGVNYVEGKVFSGMLEGGYDIRVGEYWQNTLSKYQKRYLRAVETLARVRKLNKSIALQVNIATDGGKQVNINEVKDANKMG